MTEAKVAQATVSEVSQTKKQAKAKNASELIRNRKLSRAPQLNFSPPRFNGTLYPYQKSSVAYCVKNKRVIVAEPTGTGKTVIASATICASQSLPVIIVCPKSLIPVWEEEIQEFAGQVIGSTQKIESVDERVTGADVTILNYGMLSYDYSENNQRLLTRLCDLDAETFIADEAHALRGESLRSYAAEKLSSGSEYRLLLTGTPVVRDETDVNRLLEILDVDLELPNKYRDLNNIMRSHCYLRHKRQVVLSDLPKRIKKKVPVEITNRAEYENIRKRNTHELSKEAGFKALYKFRKTAALGKIEYIERLVRQIDEPAVVFAIHRDVQNRLIDAFPQAKRVTADLSTEERSRQVELFQEGQSDVIICAIGSTPEQSPGGVGIEITRASHAIFCELGWTHSHMVQASNRVHRLGQQDPVRLWFPVAKNTIDEKIWDLIEEREILTNKCTDGDISPERLIDKLK